jgi:methylmalonyl-CoA mutase, N-terminal domain
VLRIDEALEGRQVERVRALRQRRDKPKWEAALRAVEEAASGDQNLMPHIIHAVESYCTVGEISDTLRRVFGEYQETVVI